MLLTIIHKRKFGIRVDIITPNALPPGEFRSNKGTHIRRPHRPPLSPIGEAIFAETPIK
jgi:hypothetical protein